MKTADINQPYRYVLLSHALGRSQSDRTTGNRARLEKALTQALGRGGGAVLPFKLLREMTDGAASGTSAVQLVQTLLANTRWLRQHGAVVIVVDDLFDLHCRDLDLFSGLLERLLHDGFDVLLLEPTGVLTSLGALKEVVSGNEFIKLYVGDLCRATGGRSVVPTEMLQAPPRRTPRQRERAFHLTLDRLFGAGAHD